MKLKHKVFNEKVEVITINNNGVKYKITSDFLGISITNDHQKGMIVYPTDDKSRIIVR